MGFSEVAASNSDPSTATMGLDSGGRDLRFIYFVYFVCFVYAPRFPLFQAC